MKNLLLLSLSLPLGAIAQDLTGTSGFMRPIDGILFESCNQVKNRALELAGSLTKPAYFLQLYPEEGRSLFYPFASDGSTEGRFRWLSQHDPRHHPYALLYFAHGAYSFRCRDNRDQYSESSANPTLSSSGREYDPLLVQLTTGTATIWHFFATDNNMDTVYVVTETPLEKLKGEEVLAKVKERLGARYMFLYVRNDPWFFGNVEDSIPFIFADSFGRRITESEYQKTQTMVCYSDYGCKVGRSRYQDAWQGPRNVPR